MCLISIPKEKRGKKKYLYKQGWIFSQTDENYKPAASTKLSIRSMKKTAAVYIIVKIAQKQ